MKERRNLCKPKIEFGINFDQLDLKWVGIQKHFYSYLLTDIDKYVDLDSLEMAYFQAWNKRK